MTIGTLMLLATGTVFLHIGMAVQHQGDYGTCALHAHTTVLDEMTQIVQGEVISLSSMQHKLKGYSEATGQTLYDGTTSQDLTEMINKQHLKYEDYFQKKLFRIGVVEKSLNMSELASYAKQRFPGVAFAHCSIKVTGGYHALAVSRLSIGLDADASNNLTVEGKNSHGGKKPWWTVTSENFVSATWLIPFVLEVVEHGSDGKVYRGPPPFTPEFERVRDYYDNNPLPGKYRMFDIVQSTISKGTIKIDSEGVVVGRGKTADHLTVVFFVLGGKRRSYVRLNEIRPFGKSSGTQFGKPQPSAHGLAKGDEVVFLQMFDFNVVPCLTRGVVSEIRATDILISIPSLAGRQVAVSMEHAGMPQMMMRADKIVEKLDEMGTTAKLGAKVMSVVSRHTWQNSDNVVKKLQPGDPGQVVCYVPKTGGEIHIDVQWFNQDYRGSLSVSDVVEHDLEKYDEAMAEKLAGGLRRGDVVRILNGPNAGDLGEVNGPVENQPKFVNVQIPSRGGRTVELKVYDAQDLKKDNVALTPSQ